MGRKKRRRLRERGTRLGGAVETVEFEVDPAAPAESRTPAGETSEESQAHPESMPLTAAETLHASVSGSDEALPDSPGDPVQDVQTLGELLQQARESRGLSLEAASARTRISTHMLRHLENDRFGEFAADAYVKGFLRNYGSFLGLDIGMLLRRYEAISGRLVERDPEILELETPRRRRRRKSLRPVVWPILTILILAALGWIFWSRGASRLGLRPRPGLQQIEEELRDRARTPNLPGLLPQKPSILLPQPPESLGPWAPGVDSLVSTGAFPVSEQAPAPPSPVPAPANPTQPRESAGDPPPPSPPQPLEDLVPPERP